MFRMSQNRSQSGGLSDAVEATVLRVLAKDWARYSNVHEKTRHAEECMWSEENLGDSATGDRQEDNITGAVNTERKSTKCRIPVLQGLCLAKL